MSHKIIILCYDIVMTSSCVNSRVHSVRVCKPEGDSLWSCMYWVLYAYIIEYSQLYLCLYLSLCFCYLSPFVSICLSVFYICLYLSLFVSICRSVFSICLCLSLFVSLFSLFVSICLYLSLFVSICLYLSLFVFRLSPKTQNERQIETWQPPLYN